MPVPTPGPEGKFMRGWAVLSTAFLGLCMPALAHAASVELKGVYANVWIIPEDRTDVNVDVRGGDGRLPTPVVRRSGGDVVVDGGLRSMNHCSGIHPGHAVNLPGFGRAAASSALNITVRTPRDAHVTVDGAVVGDVRGAHDLDLSTNGCSHWNIGDVGGILSIRQEGAASITAGAADTVKLDLSGLTQVNIRAARALNVDMSGMGNVRLKSISGPVGASLSGMGSVDIASGRAQKVKAEVSGMGAFRFHGSASELDAEVSGIGGVHVDHVDGAVNKSVSGIGRVTVGR
jgi:hypothetical protein